MHFSGVCQSVHGDVVDIHPPKDSRLPGLMYYAVGGSHAALTYIQHYTHVYQTLLQDEACS